MHTSDNTLSGILYGQPHKPTTTDLLTIPCFRALVGFAFASTAGHGPTVLDVLRGVGPPSRTNGKHVSYMFDPVESLTKLTQDEDLQLVSFAQAFLSLICDDNWKNKIRREMIFFQLTQEIYGNARPMTEDTRCNWNENILPCFTNTDTMKLWEPAPVPGGYRVWAHFGGEPFKSEHDARQCAYLLSIYYNQGIDAARKVFDTNPDVMRRGMVYALFLESWLWAVNYSLRRDLFDQAVYNLK